MSLLASAENENARTATPLTRLNAVGERYERLPQVEAQIVRLLAFDCSALVEAARHDYQSPAHLKDEALCYFIRERLRAGDDDGASLLIEALLRRHTATLARRVSRGAEERHREDCRSQITTELLTQLLDLTSDQSDFAQVRFGLYFERLTITVIERFQRQQRHEASAASAHKADEADMRDPLDGLADERALSNEDRLLLADALAYMSEESRVVFTLRYFDEWQIQSDADDEPSISRHLNVTPRTVSNRLKRAEAELRRWREGKTR